MFQRDRDDATVFYKARFGVPRHSINCLVFLVIPLPGLSRVHQKRFLRTFGASAKPKREQLCCLQRDSDESTASFVKTPLGLRGFPINVLVFFLIRALGGSCLHRKCVRTPKPEEEPNNYGINTASGSMSWISPSVGRFSGDNH